MSGENRIRELMESIAKAKSALEELKTKGAGIPAAEKNAIRLLGTLNALEVQFHPLLLEEDGTKEG